MIDGRRARSNLLGRECAHHVAQHVYGLAEVEVQS
jgi:hypothetical protein